MSISINPSKEGWLETVLHGVSALGFLLPRNSRVSAGDFALLIEQHYSTENPKTVDVVENRVGREWVCWLFSVRSISIPGRVRVGHAACCCTRF